MAFTTLEVQEAEQAIAVQANSDDMFRLGLIYSTDVEDRGPDFVEAHKWFSLAAMMGSSPAKTYQAQLKNEMSPHDVTLALKAARGWLAENRQMVRTAA